MNVVVIGTGYVGLTTAVSLAMQGHQVAGIDVDESKIIQLRQGKTPFYEPGLDEALPRVLGTGTLRFTTRLQDAAHEATVVFICVGTPSGADGSADLRFLLNAVDNLLELQEKTPAERVIAVKSTVPVGTTDYVAQQLQSFPELHVVSNPEFLREGSALRDALEPSRIVIGAETDRAFALMEQLYLGISAPRVLTTRANAEMIKYASNAFLATRISFMNELARLCDKLGTDVKTVARGMGLDSRIGPEFLQAGLGYGGSCFPKDTTALLQLAKQHEVSLTILEKVREVNLNQPEWFIRRMRDQLATLSGKRIAVLGLSFKPETDDIREAPSLKVLSLLLAEGADVAAYDPVASPSVQRIFPHVTYADTPYDACNGADAAILVTEWKECTQLDWVQVKERMSAPFLFDGRNAWPAKQLKDIGFSYTGVGRS
ncbi:UDP-glucose dehydrogenase family protein [Brevibacillus sp. H7]|uniref:UDP-glucose dehydrogenase family protein n=1 Tax=Brevibacillus sp. H7 TaxID=3349138 RepID=UPI00382276C0